MATYIETEGNLIKFSKRGDYDLIGHGCNCKKNWGKGIALEMRGAYPLAYEADKMADPKLGEFSFCDAYDEVTILNIYSQYYPGKPKYSNDSAYLRYKAIDEAMEKINEKYHGAHIGLPLIGAGLAGLRWQKIKKSIKTQLINLDITIVHYNPNIKIDV